MPICTISKLFIAEKCYLVPIYGYCLWFCQQPAFFIHASLLLNVRYIYLQIYSNFNYRKVSGRNFVIFGRKVLIFVLKVPWILIWLVLFPKNYYWWHYPSFMKTPRLNLWCHSHDFCYISHLGDLYLDFLSRTLFWHSDIWALSLFSRPRPISWYRATLENWSTMLSVSRISSGRSSRTARAMMVRQLVNSLQHTSLDLGKSQN